MGLNPRYRCLENCLGFSGSVTFEIIDGLVELSDMPVSLRYVIDPRGYPIATTISFSYLVLIVQEDSRKFSSEWLLPAAPFKITKSSVAPRHSIRVMI